MGHTFVIAEAGSCHDNDLQKAHRLIEAAKECGADAVKFQWTSDAEKMAQRRGLGADAAAMYKKYLQQSKVWLSALQQHAYKVGLDFMCTVYLIEDIATIAPLVKRFKVSAFECEWHDFILRHPYPNQVIVSVNPGKTTTPLPNVVKLHCISDYPTALENLKLSNLGWFDCPDNITQARRYHGLSDHTTSTLTGALAVAAGATIIEKHIKLFDTQQDCPDYPHSLVADTSAPFGFATYVANIREAEKAL